MGERAVIERGMEALEEIGQGESTTFVLPQELTSLLSRYGKHLTGSDVATDGESLDSLEFDGETREMLGLDDIEEILGQIEEETEMDVEEMEQQAQAIKEGADPADIKGPDEVISEMDEEMPDADVGTGSTTSEGDEVGTGSTTDGSEDGDGN
jgi:hypothetical protein